MVDHNLIWILLITMYETKMESMDFTTIYVCLFSLKNK